DLANKIDDSELEINFETSRIGKNVINFENVSFYYPDKPILKDFNLLIQNKDRICIVGDNGKGKSTLLNLIAVDLQADSGKVDIGET
ncbi:ATP-binding cassette domain-containing protein, partial [Streptococcus suis]